MPKKKRIEKKHLYRFNCSFTTLSYNLGDPAGCDPDCNDQIFYLISDPKTYLMNTCKTMLMKWLWCLYDLIAPETTKSPETPLDQLMKILVPEPKKGSGKEVGITDLGIIEDKEIETLTKFQILSPLPKDEDITWSVIAEKPGYSS